MRRILLWIFLLAFAGVVIAAERPDWATHKFAGTPDKVFDAAKTAIAGQHHEVKDADAASHTVKFHVGTTAWSWGYNMVLKVEAEPGGGSTVTVDIDRSGGKSVSWGSGSKEVKKIFAHMEEMLGKG